jgi:Zn-dependent protease
MMDNLQLGVAMFAMIILAISLHEMAHAWMAHRCGDDTAAHMGRLTLNPVVHFDPVGLMFILFGFFGWGRPVEINPLRMRQQARDTMLTAAAGPASNLIQAIVLTILYHIITTNFVMNFVESNSNLVGFWKGTHLVLIIGIYINLGLMFFNLIPLFPLDGEKILTYFLPYEASKKFDAFRQYSMQVLFLLLISDFIIGFSILGTYFRLTIDPFCRLLIGYSPFHPYG